MHGLYGNPVTIEQAPEMHQTAHVTGDDIASSGALDPPHFVFTHGGRDVRKFHRKGTSKATAAITVLHLPKINFLHSANQLARLAGNAQFTKEMARIVIGDHFRETGSRTFHPQD